MQRDPEGDQGDDATGMVERTPLRMAPPTAHYIPEWVTSAQEEYLTRKILTAPKPKWTQLRRRRLQNWGGKPHPKGMIGVPLPDWLQSLAQRLQKEEWLPFEANHVLVNEYQPGEGIMPHEDGPLYEPHFAILSLSGSVQLHFWRKDDARTVVDQSSMQDSDSLARGKNLMGRGKPAFSLLLQPRSLLVIKDDLYHNYLHGIDETDEERIEVPRVVNLHATTVADGEVISRQLRTSLTIRRVKKVRSGLLRLRPV